MHSASANHSLYWDIVKGIGIVAILLGHCGHPASAFFYLFHLVLFFFVTGYLYEETKYKDKSYLYFGKRLARIWPRYIFYALLFVILHNCLIDRGLYSGLEYYNHTMMLANWMNSLTLNCTEPVAGALWFVPVWLISGGLFSFVHCFGRFWAKKYKIPHLGLWFSGIVCAGLGLIGVFLNMRSCQLYYNVQAALLAVPFYFVAHLVRTCSPTLTRYLSWMKRPLISMIGCIASGICLRLVNTRLYIFIDIASMSIPGLIFYPISFLGIYFTLSFTRLLQRVRPLAMLLAFFGRHTFDIMALHFLIFKLGDWIYAYVFLHEMPPNLSSFPSLYGQTLWPIYVPVALLISSVAGDLLDRVQRHLLKTNGPSF